MLAIRPFIAILILAFVSSWSASIIKDDPEHVRPKKSERPKAGVARGRPNDIPDVLSAAAAALDAFYAEQARLETERLEQERLAAEEAARLEAERQARARPPVPAAPRRTSGSVGDCTGFPVPDAVIQRESGGSPNAANPSGAYGCTQIMPGWWSGACAGLDKYSVDGQRACTQIIVNTQGPSAWSATW
jgi:Transglycosylase-like domain